MGSMKKNLKGKMTEIFDWLAKVNGWTRIMVSILRLKG